jgi:putative hydrolase
LFTNLATALQPHNTDGDVPDDPMSAMMANLSTMMAPAMMGMSVGSMIGALASHALGQYEIPLARPHTSEILIVASSVDAFATEWEIPTDDVRMWVLIHELASHAVLAAPAIAEGLTTLVQAHVSAFRPNPDALMSSLTDLDPSDTDAMAAVQNLFSNPMVMMGASRTAEQEALAPVLDAHVAAISGYIDYVVDAVSARLLGGASPIAEAVRRRRVQNGTNSHLVEQLLGISQTRSQQQRGRAFVNGIIERDGAALLPSLVSAPGNLPTPSEIDAPGLWLARLEIQ